MIGARLSFLDRGNYRLQVWNDGEIFSTLIKGETAKSNKQAFAPKLVCASIINLFFLPFCIFFIEIFPFFT